MQQAFDATLRDDADGWNRQTAATHAITELDRRAIAYSVHAYADDTGDGAIGLQAARALGVPPAVVLKTLMVLVDNRPACAIIPSDAQLSMKRLATVLGGRAAVMMQPPAAERTTGYVVGGISPLGQKRRVPTAIEERALLHPFVLVNAGRRGLQLRVSPGDLRSAVDAAAVPLIAVRDPSPYSQSRPES